MERRTCLYGIRSSVMIVATNDSVGTSNVRRTSCLVVVERSVACTVVGAIADWVGGTAVVAVTCHWIVERPGVDASEDGVQSSGEEGTSEGTDPIDPVTAPEAGDDSRTERASCVHGGTGVLVAPQRAGEHRHANSDRGELGSVPSSDENENRQNQQGSDEHLNESCLSLVDVWSSEGVGGERTREESEDRGRGGDGGDEVSNAVHYPSDGTDDAEDHERSSDIRIEDSAGRTIEDPASNEERDAECEGVVEEGDNLPVWSDETVANAGLRVRQSRLVRRRLNSAKNHEQPEVSTEEL